ncbi:hypothetical protein A3841_13295 [Pontibacter flavimaris]|uniref:Uncharacterized protein n=1 Tax=Pontibacter flavimaris TaxID=1797110 RepID=A0A1Q5PF01_9BACT|nr:hypothetical protein A3841_13295 [Pontibacter flavimaris]
MAMTNRMRQTFVAAVAKAAKGIERDLYLAYYGDAVEDWFILCARWRGSELYFRKHLDQVCPFILSSFVGSIRFILPCLLESMRPALAILLIVFVPSDSCFWYLR